MASDARVGRSFARAVRQSIAYAEAAFDVLCEGEGVVPCAELLADATQKASDVGGGWSITLSPTNVLLNAGPVRAFNMSTGRVWFATTDFVGKPPRWVEERTAERETPTLYKSVPIATRDFVTAPRDVERLPAAMREAFLGYVVEAVRRRRGRSLYIESHSTHVVEFLNQLLGRSLAQPPGVLVASDEEPETLYVEGRSRTFRLGQKERSREARAACIAKHGVECLVCGLNFGERYGKLGEGYIEVHHLNPLARATGTREVDPAKDLVPLCPNCHRMLHVEDPPLTPAQLRANMRLAELARSKGATRPSRKG